LELVLEGRGKVAGVDEVVYGPLIRADVKRAFTLTPPPGIVSLKPGESQKLMLPLVREKPFHGVVRWTVAGAVPGVVIPANGQIAAEASELVLPLTVAKTAAATAAAVDVTLTLTATIEGLNYPHPPVAVRIQVVKE
jgi:hypothetical protein